MIKLECVATFLAVAKCGSFREAAKCIGISQSAVTQHVKRLEESLGVSLIVRNNAGSKLTAEGCTFLPYAENLIRTHDQASAVFKKNSVVIGASSNTGIYLLPPYLKAYESVSTDKLDVVITSNPAIVDKLQKLEVDVALMEWWDDRPGFVSSAWRSEDLVLIVPPNHPWAGRRSVPADWLKGRQLLGGEAGSGTGHLLQRHFGAEARMIGVSMQLGSTEAVKHAVQAGLGISLVMAAAVTREAQSGLLSAITLEGKPMRKVLYVVRRDYNGAHSARAARFADFLLKPRPPANAGLPS